MYGYKLAVDDEDYPQGFDEEFDDAVNECEEEEDKWWEDVEESYDFPEEEENQ